MFLPLFRIALLCPLLLMTEVCACVAQTPTMDAIRIRLRQMEEVPPSAVVTQSRLSSRNGYPRGRIVVKTSNPLIAQRAAVRYVYVHAVRNVGVPRQEFAQLRKEMIEAASEIKNLKAKIVHTEKTKEGYAVEVELAQSTGELTQDLQRTALSNFRLIALLPETIDGQRLGSPKVETALVGALANRQFRVYDWNFVTSRRPLKSLISTTMSQQNEVAVELGNRFLANVIVVGRVEATFSQENSGIISYRASVNLRVIKTDTGQILTAHEYVAKGFGQDKPQAANEALEALALKVAEELPDEMISHFEEYPITIQIPVQKPGQTAEVESFLRGLTGVKSIERTTGVNGTSFRLISREKPVVLATHIQQSRDYRLSTNDTKP